jgi:alanyl aminopeptidase
MKLQTAVLTLIALTFLITSCSDSGDDATTLSLLEEPDAPVAQLGNATTPVGYRLELTIDPAQDRFSGRTEIDIKLSQAAQHVWLHGQNLSIETSSVRQGDKVIPATWEQVLPSGVSKLALSEPLVTGTATISISYSAAFDRSSNALYTVQRGQYRYAATQLQPIAARQIFPSFDEPRFKVPFDITILARPDDVVVTTTPETSARREGKMMRHEFKRTPPLPTYLLAFVVGPYDLVEADPIPPNSVRDRPLPLRGLTAKGQGAQIEYALANTAGILEILEDYFGIPYPYDKLDLIATPAGFGGAMENVGAIIYDEYLLLLEEDSSINQRRAFVSVHAHELAHMWFGNLVTPDWWTDIWLNESFATWISYKVSSAYWPEGEFDRSVQKGALGAMNNDSLAAARMVREEVLHNDAIMKSFDGITYQKGGGVLGMIERYSSSMEISASSAMVKFSSMV